jgi:sugar O-acyltransferase (sialic acid O-acetyltransferase NeuD family)
MAAAAIFGIFGASGCGRGVIPIAREQLANQASAELVFIDDAKAGHRINGHNVFDLDSFAQLGCETLSVAIAIANPATRRRIAERCAAAGLSFFQVLAKQAVIMDDVEMGEGAVISPFVTLTSNIRIGCHFHANLYSYVEHDCNIGDFVTFAPGVQCNGNVCIEDDVYVGAGAILRQGKPGSPLTIGRGAIIGMGAVVTRDVPAGVTVIGNPARIFERLSSS